MKLIVGLGNPGRKYEQTRHNVGFAVLAVLARKFLAAVPRERFHAEVVELTISDEQVLLVAPQTYMNASGRSVRAAIDFYKLPLENLLVVCDDFHLPTGKLRFRSRGSSGGQKGLQNIIEQLGSEGFGRLRLGVGPVPDRWDPADFVLGKFTNEEKPQIEVAIATAAEAVNCWLTEGIDECMNRFN